MNTCKTCTHWSGPAEASEYNLGGHAKCNSPKVSAHGDQYADGASDAEGYGGVLTGPDFGCIHWEDKPQ